MKNQEIAQRIVDRMLDAMRDGGKLPWVKPWTDRDSVRVLDGYTEISVPVHCWSRSGKPYKGINQWLLSGGPEGEYITFNQANAEGGHIRKGAHGHTIVYWQMIRRETGDLDANGNPVVKLLPMLKYYTVFSLSDVEGLEPKHHPEPETIRIPHYHTEAVEGIDESEYDAAAEDIIARYAADQHLAALDCKGNSSRAYYSPSLDSVTVPCIRQYADKAEYYSTLFHELGHSTGHASRLNRFSGDGKIAAFGDEAYSREELVAEITAASILSTLGMESGNTFRNSAAYVQSWSEHIKADPMMFVTAAGRAEKAIGMILGTADAVQADAE
jgi:antirestriction protein ArdC